METKIKLNKREDILRVKIEDENGKDTGNYLEFDLQDIELPLRYQQAIEEHKKNANYIKMQFALIDKKPDKRGKKALSSNEEEKYNVLLEFYRRETKTLDKVLGDGGTAKLLNGRKPYYEMYQDIMEYLAPLSEIFTSSFEKMNDRIIKKYATPEELENILK